MDLAKYAIDLAEQRDEHIASARQRASADDGYAVGLAAGTAEGLRIALSYLWVDTRGEHGQSYDDQPGALGQHGAS